MGYIWLPGVVGTGVLEGATFLATPKWMLIARRQDVTVLMVGGDVGS